jgi:hypothetical protein
VCGLFVWRGPAPGRARILGWEWVGVEVDICLFRPVCRGFSDRETKEAAIAAILGSFHLSIMIGARIQRTIRCPWNICDIDKAPRHIKASRKIWCRTVEACARARSEVLAAAADSKKFVLAEQAKRTQYRRPNPSPAIATTAYLGTAHIIYTQNGARVHSFGDQRWLCAVQVIGQEVVEAH